MADNYNALLYSKTNIDGYFFDAYTDVEYTHNLTVTSHPVQSGANIADHAYMEPKEIMLTVCMSDVMKSRYSGQFSGGWSRSRNAWDVLTKIQENRLPVSVLTRLGRYDNMLITSLKQTDDYKQLYGLKASVTLRQIFVVKTKYAKVSLSPATTNKSVSGAVNSSLMEDVSILYRLFNYSN